jgi:DNA polymerase III subunit epsilon
VFAVIDIETTGGRAETDRITEIAIILHDGEKVINRYCTLINPRCKIPYQITQLTGISDDMVRDAPAFHEVAKEIIELTEGAVFVAHNVRFDYGFIKAAYKNLGYNYQRETLCTVRLSRATFKGLPSYSLGKLCDSLDIKIENRHRALGDAEATAILLGKIFEQQKQKEANWLKEEAKKTSIPPLLDEVKLHQIPEGITGVYYFHNSLGNVIYVGKAIDIKKRILQHFAITVKGTRTGIQLKNEIADISYESTGSELVALLLESDEIKKIKPIYNVMQKRGRAIPYYGIFKKYDPFGYVNLCIEKLKEGDEPIYTADNISSARDTMYQMIEKYNLCLAKCDLHKIGGPCFDHQLHKCKGACIGMEDAESYNLRAFEAIRKNSFQSESFLIVCEGRHLAEKSVVCVERGQYKGFGFVDLSFGEPSTEDMRDAIKKYPHNRDIQQILCTYLRRSDKKIAIHSEMKETGI